ncbi:radical S-adenosyl methionine domain-containing protein 1 [Entomortierella chlamydospora]|uniref:Radical S-adenosyl methionine domain-containing protein 1 n=1 Tax=Entomortierella chlamydospora TaxID=101097 RepID=A0A9P6SZG5_9FUNG|nr:radical S-adenosyl methionine domain-containing protein 1 [Entomortierella chlamydospora]
MATDLEPFSVYVHWPYCSSKCTYCNFNKYVDPHADNERMELSLLKELKTEISYWGLDNKTRPVRSVYFGGGTPSLARPNMFDTILSTLDQLCGLSKDTEVTVEGNPSSHILKELGRDHTPSSALRSLLDARSKSYQLTKMFMRRLHKDVTQGKVTLPDSELAADMYETMIEMTSEAGFEHYEVSNFAKNQAYRPGAHGRMRNPKSGELQRTFNIRDPAGWMQQCSEVGTGRRRTVAIDPEETKQELVALGMRTKRGVELEMFKKATGQELIKYLNTEALTTCVEANLVVLSPQALSPTERGMAVADELVARLLP